MVRHQCKSSPDCSSQYMGILRKAGINKEIYMKMTRNMWPTLIYEWHLSVKKCGRAEERVFQHLHFQKFTKTRQILQYIALASFSKIKMQHELDRHVECQWHRVERWMVRGLLKVGCYPPPRLVVLVILVALLLTSDHPTPL